MITCCIQQTSKLRCLRSLAHFVHLNDFWRNLTQRRQRDFRISLFHGETQCLFTQLSSPGMAALQDWINVF